MNMKPKVILLLITFSMFLTTGNVFAVDNQNNGVYKILGATDVKTSADISVSVNIGSVNLYFFYSKTCPHCHDEALFLAKLKNELGDKLKIYSFELSESYGNLELYEKFGRTFVVDLSQIQVPGTFIGEKSLIGYGSDEYDGANIRNLVEQCIKLGCRDLGAEIINQKQEQGSGAKNKTLPIAVGAAVIIGLVVIILVRRNNK